MKKLWMTVSQVALGAALCLAGHAAQAQAPTGAPAGSTGLCNDGSYWSNATKSGACRGHKGVKTWWGEGNTDASKNTGATPAPNGQAVSATASAPAPKPVTPPPTPKPAQTAAAGGGPGQVWVNTSTKVYHCPGDRWYGKTKEGKYMSESDAKASGAKPDAGKTCKS